MSVTNANASSNSGNRPAPIFRDLSAQQQKAALSRVSQLNKAAERQGGEAIKSPRAWINTTLSETQNGADVLGHKPRLSDLGESAQQAYLALVPKGVDGPAAQKRYVAAHFAQLAGKVEREQTKNGRQGDVVPPTPEMPTLQEFMNMKSGQARKNAWIPILEAAAEKVGVPVDWATDSRTSFIIAGESAWLPKNPNPTSSADGLGQWTDGIWNAYAPKTKGVVADRYDIWAQAVTFWKYLDGRYGSLQAAYDHKRSTNWW